MLKKKIGSRLKASGARRLLGVPMKSDGGAVVVQFDVCMV